MLTSSQLYDCQGSLSRICANIKDMNTKVQNICLSKTVCNFAFNQIMTRIKKTAEELSDEKITEHNRCNMLQMRCHFLEHHGMWYLNEKCKKLKEHCYNRVRKEVAKVIVYDLLRGTSGILDVCIQKLQHACHSLSRRSPELLTLCIDPTSVCKEFALYSKKECETYGVQFLLVKEQITKKNCIEWLEICYYTISDCQFLHSLCRLFQLDCAEKGFFYNPRGHNFDLFKIPHTDMDENGVHYAYEKLRDLGIDVTQVTGNLNLLVPTFLTGNSYIGYSECKRMLDKKCSSMKYLELVKNTCTSMKLRNIYNACFDIYAQTRDYSYSLKNKLTQGIGFWWYPYLPLSKKECEEYLITCYFMTKTISYWLGYNICKDIRLVCYQADLERAADMALMKKLNKKLKLKNNSALNENQNECKKILLEECKNFMYYSYHVLYKCLHPDQTCKNLTTLIHENSRKLETGLRDAIVDLDYEKCKEYNEECRKLGSYFNSTIELCKQLHTNCENINRMAELGVKALQKGSSLRNESVCLTYIGEYCIRNSTAYECIDKKKTCKYILKSVSAYCTRLLRYLSYSEFHNSLRYIGYSRCFNFNYYCKLLKGSCHSLNDKCFKLQKACNNISTQINKFNDLVKTYGDEISGYDKCYRKLTQECRNPKKQKNATLCVNINTTCKDLVIYLEKICDKLALRIFKLSSSSFNSSAECQHLTSLCSSIGSSCTGINDRATRACSTATTICKLSPLPKPPAPAPAPGPPGPPPPSEPELPTPSKPQPKPKPTNSSVTVPSIATPQVTPGSPTIPIPTIDTLPTDTLTTGTSATRTSSKRPSIKPTPTGRTSTMSPSTSTRLIPRPTVSPGSPGKGYGVKMQGLQMIELIWAVVGVVLGLWIII
ncbi:hypothetical protein PMAC_003019 [Pneumocystis sp. 'macacae']|nr:hypothetical protein PMAC_003019 [Pneumocystis sp. 'macacae']